MKLKTIILLSLPFILNAEECSSIIALSKTTSSTIKNRDTFEKHVSNFCKEYSKATGSSNSRQYGISYEFLSLSMGSSRTNSESIASKYCSASNSTKSSKDAYKEYIETISPYAYSSYKDCISMSKEDLKFKLDLASMLPNEFSLSVLFSSQTREDTAELSFYAPKGVTCSWHEFNTTSISIPSGSTSLLNCSRENSHKRTYVKVIRKDGNTQLSIPWGAYDKNGTPMDMLRKLEKKYTTLLSDNEKLQNSLKNSVTAFNTKECPSGWEEYTLAYGRFIRGLDKSGKIDPTKNRKIGSIQEDMFKSHNHNDGKWNKLSSYDGRDTVHAQTDDSGGELNIRRGGSIQSRGGSETRPKNVALLYCIKR